MGTQRLAAMTHQLDTVLKVLAGVWVVLMTALAFDKLGVVGAAVVLVGAAVAVIEYKKRRGPDGRGLSARPATGGSWCSGCWCCWPW